MTEPVNPRLTLCIADLRIAWCEQNTAAQISVSLSGARILIAEKDDGISVSISAECDKESGSIVETFVTYNELKTDKGES